VPAFDNLVVYRKQLGDTLLLQPALETLSTRGSVALSARPGFEALLVLMPGPVEAAPRWLPRARRVYCLEATGAAVGYTAQALGTHRILALSKDEASRWLRPIFDETLIIPGGDKYRAALFHDMVGGKCEQFRPPRLHRAPDDWRPPGLPAAYGVIHPTSAWQRKTWSAQNWIRALSGLRTDLPWVVSSGPSDWEVTLAETLANGLGGGTVCLAGLTTLRQFLGLLSGASAVVCVDGSASHLAAAFGKPTLTLFGPTNPLHWHWPSPRTPRLWAAEFAAEKKPAVDAIPVPAVRAAVVALLEQIDG
jgi:ADP-heptose:LPS heptosyltransferase